MGDQNKLLERFAKLMEEQTEEPTKKDVSSVVSKFYSQQKKNKKVEGAALKENKPKRAPTAYNIFFKEQMAILKDSEKDMNKDDCMTAKAKMAHVAELWKAKKDDKFEEALSHIEPEEVEEAEPEPEEEAEPEPEPEPEPPKKKDEPKSKFVGTRGGGRGGAKR